MLQKPETLLKVEVRVETGQEGWVEALKKNKVPHVFSHPHKQQQVHICLILWKGQMEARGGGPDTDTAQGPMVKT